MKFGREIRKRNSEEKFETEIRKRNSEEKLGREIRKRNSEETFGRAAGLATAGPAATKLHFKAHTISTLFPHSKPTLLPALVSHIFRTAKLLIVRTAKLLFQTAVERHKIFHTFVATLFPHFFHT